MHEVHINPQERLAVIPAVSFQAIDGSLVSSTDLEASMDQGETWVDARVSGTTPYWLVANSDFPGPDDPSDESLTDFVVTAGRTEMWIRHIASPVTAVAQMIEIVRLS